MASHRPVMRHSNSSIITSNSSSNSSGFHHHTCSSNGLAVVVGRLPSPPPGSHAHRKIDLCSQPRSPHIRGSNNSNSNSHSRRSLNSGSPSTGLSRGRPPPHHWRCSPFSPAPSLRGGGPRPFSQNDPSPLPIPLPPLQQRAEPRSSDWSDPRGC